ncbi:hypothetical protein GALL_464680 [mine drainage metagenome]|uniref:Uncharacterized protein n=1 Tax=mine drainage metagenome TaxID=410659 RepID=A0A1J5PVS7_9ZZZZ
MSDTKLTTTIIMADRLSIRKPTSNEVCPLLSQVYTAPL